MNLKYILDWITKGYAERLDKDTTSVDFRQGVSWTMGAFLEVCRVNGLDLEKDFDGLKNKHQELDDLANIKLKLLEAEELINTFRKKWIGDV